MENGHHRSFSSILILITFPTAGPEPEMMTKPLVIIDFKHGFIKFLSLLPPRICIQHIFELSISYIGRFLLSGVVDVSISEGIVASISLGNVSSCSMFLPYFYRNQVELNEYLLHCT